MAININHRALPASLVWLLRAKRSNLFEFLGIDCHVATVPRNDGKNDGERRFFNIMIYRAIRT